LGDGYITLAEKAVAEAAAQQVVPMVRAGLMLKEDAAEYVTGKVREYRAARQFLYD